MKKSYLSLAAVVLLGSTTLNADTLEDVFKKSTLEGSIGWYGHAYDRKGGSANDGFSNGFGAIHFETAPLYGFSVGLSGFGSFKTSEENDGDYKATIEDRAVLSEAYIKVEHEGVGHVIVGRQDVDFNWMTDVIEGATIELSFVENFIINMAWMHKQAVIGFDEISETFETKNGHKGVYMLEAKYTPVEGLEINPYYYHAHDVFNAPGVKVSLSFEPQNEFKTTTLLAYTKGNSDVTGILDGYVVQLEQGVEFMSATVALGYIKTDKNGTAGLESFGDQSPFEEGNHVFDADTQSYYVTASYTMGDVTVGGLYGQSTYDNVGNKEKEKEFNLSFGYKILENLETSLVYVNVDNEDNAQSYTGIKALVEYKF